MTIELVVSSSHGRFKSLLTPLAGPDSSPVQHIIYHHDREVTDIDHYAGPGHTREAGTFLKHVTTRYDKLSALTAFVHDDAWLHNPVWPQWLSCLRSNASYATLSPIYQRSAPPGGPGLLAHALNLNLTARTRYPPWSCCFSIVAGREAIRTTSRDAYKAADGLIQQGKGATAFNLENSVHLLHPARSDWLTRCTNYRCEEPLCHQTVGFVPVAGPLTHGLPIRGESSALRSWQERACGVQDIDLPEHWQLASVRESIAIECNDAAFGVQNGTGGPAMRTLNDVLNRTGCDGTVRTRLKGWMTAVTAKYSSSFHRQPRDVPSAKIAIFALKGRMCTGLVRCWQACCAECSRRLKWCVAWEWTLSGRCSLSMEKPIRANLPSFDRVIGRFHH